MNGNLLDLMQSMILSARSPEYPLAQLHAPPSSNPGETRSIFSMDTGHCNKYGMFSAVIRPSSSGPLSVHVCVCVCTCVCVRVGEHGKIYEDRRL